jgi:hypothetical protein
MSEHLLDPGFNSQYCKKEKLHIINQNIYFHIFENV